MNVLVRSPNNTKLVLSVHAVRSSNSNSNDGFEDFIKSIAEADEIIEMENDNKKKKKKSVLKATQKKGKRCKSKKKKIVSIKLVDMSVSDDGIRNGSRQLGLA
jgi:rhamnose utilization protein RhaD (predicted bifunctional aldolase and dehydrogenase)